MRSILQSSIDKEFKKDKNGNNQMDKTYRFPVPVKYRDRVQHTIVHPLTFTTSTDPMKYVTSSKAPGSLHDMSVAAYYVNFF